MIYLNPHLSFLFRFFVFFAASFASLVPAGFAQAESETAAGYADHIYVDHRPFEFRAPFTRPESTKLPESANGIWTTARLNSVPLFGGLDQSFRPDVWASPGTVRASALQADGKLLIGGFFRTINGERRDGLVRLNADHSIDAAFNVDIRGNVSAIAIQPDGKIVIGGSFTSINGASRNRIARLNADGSLDTNFNVGIGVDNIVNDVLVQPDGKIVIAGSFIYAVVGDQPNYHIARLNADGTLDHTFSSAIHSWQPSVPPSIIYGIALQADGKIVAAGLVMMDVNGVASPRPIVRFNTNGTFDPSFTPPSINSNLYDAAIQPDGKIIIGGFFTTVGGSTRRYLARLNSEGTLDAGFDTGTEVPAPVRTLQLKADGKILAGPLTNISLFGLARQFNSNGALDKTFSLSGQILTGGVNTIAVTAGGKIFAGGLVSLPSADEPNTAMLFNADGPLDPNFYLSSTAIGSVRSIVVQPDGKVLAGGSFNRVNGTRKNLIARMNPDGSLDQSFNVAGPTPTSGFSAVQITTLLRQPDGKILVAGTNINNGSASAMVVRLNADGSWDSSFLQGAIPGRASARTIALQSDGKILVAFAESSTAGGAPGGMTRLNADGSVDQSFAPPVLPYEKMIALSDGKILASGAFYMGYVNSGTNQSDFYYGVIRLNGDGSHDTTFRAGFYSDLDNGLLTGAYAMELLPNGKILIGGKLYTPGSTTPVGVARLEQNGTLDLSFERKIISNPFEYPRVEEVRSLPGGRIIAAGLFSHFGDAPAGNLTLLNEDGSIDPSFTGSTDNTVHEIAVQSDGHALIGGDFDMVGNSPQTALARLKPSGGNAGATLFDYDGDGKADLSVRRPSDNVWHLLRESLGYTAMQWGVAGDKMAPADYDGDGKTDVAVFRPSEGKWYIHMSQSNTFQTYNWGAEGDLPLPSDRDADGRADLVVYRPADNTWYTRFADSTFLAFPFGEAGDKPVAGDFDADGRSDMAVFRPSNSTWYIIRSTQGYYVQTWGETGDIPVAADFDGDGKTDHAVFRPSSGQWFLSQTAAGFSTRNWGQAGDVPVPADYDGDGKADVAVFRPSEGNWYIAQSTAGILVQNFGVAGDAPTQSAFHY